LTGQVLSAIGTGDFNGDGRADLAVANWNNPTAGIVIFLRNAGNTGFTQASSNFSGTNPRQFAVADYDGDGTLDLAVVNNGSRNVTVLLGQGNGTFLLEDATTPVTGANPSGITAGDFNGDGRPDLAVTNTGDGTVTVLLRNEGIAGFTPGLGSPIPV